MTVRVLRLPGPFDMATSVESFRRWGDDMLDRWDGDTLVRTLPVQRETLAVACRPVGTLEEPAVEVACEREDLLDAAATAVAASVLTAPGPLAALTERDPVLAHLERSHPGIRPVLQPDLLDAIVRAISAQQVNLRWASTTRRRLAEAFGRRHGVAGHTVYSLDAGTLAGARVADIRALQFTTRKAEYIVGAAQAVADGLLDIDELRLLDDDEVIARLRAVRGLGLWTAEWFLCRSLGRPRVVAGDLGVRKAVGAAYLGGAMASEAEARAATAHWGAAATVAQEVLLHAWLEDPMLTVAGQA